MIAGGSGGKIIFSCLVSEYEDSLGCMRYCLKNQPTKRTSITLVGMTLAPPFPLAVLTLALHLLLEAQSGVGLECLDCRLRCLWALQFHLLVASLWCWFWTPIVQTFILVVPG